jgi:hypothetical protein
MYTDFFRRRFDVAIVDGVFLLQEFLLVLVFMFF